MLRKRGDAGVHVLLLDDALHGFEELRHESCWRLVFPRERNEMQSRITCLYVAATSSQLLHTRSQLSHFGCLSFEAAQVQCSNPP